MLITCESHVCRNAEASDTDSTEDEASWGGLGKFEYSGKGLPHALFHQTELVIRGGHHMAFCSFASEQAHKVFIKLAAQFARVYASINQSQVSMLNWVNEHALFKAVIRFGKKSRAVKSRRRKKNRIPTVLRDPLPYSEHWSGQPVRNNRLPVRWETQFLSAQVRLTNMELMRILCSKLGLDDSTRAHVLLAQELRWEFYGSLVLSTETVSKKFVGVSPARRDFVHLITPEKTVKGVPITTCWSAQVIVFVKISGFENFMTIPAWFRDSPDNVSSVTLALIRWLSPHSLALVRDKERRPLCSPPFEFNHALWTFTKTDRPDLTDAVILSNSQCYPDADSVVDEKNTRFDLISIRSLTTYMNCTVLGDKILETITIPF